jgi:hypothetical protein
MPLSLALGGTAAAAAVLTIALLVFRPHGILPAEVLGSRRTS